MKNLFLFLVLVVFTVNVNAQDDKAEDFNRWQARFRLVSVVPSPGDNLPGAEVDISTAYVPELDFTYFFTKNFAAELILATAKHDVDLDVDDDTSASLGHVWLLPPTLNLQYHFYVDQFKPYIGAGVNYTFFYGVDEGDFDDIEYDNGFGFSLQAGIDFNLNDKWFLNFDVKHILLSTDVEVSAGEATIPVEVDINPTLIGLGIGMKF